MSAVAPSSPGLDIAHLAPLFFEEAGDNAAQLEQLLLHLDPAHADDETLNAIFRCAHSIKGGAASFGFDAVAHLTHQMESLLDRLRRRELQPTAGMIDTLLKATDRLHLLLEQCRDPSAAAPPDDALGQALEQLASADAATPAPGAPTPATAIPPTARAAPADGRRSLRVRLQPAGTELRELIDELFRDIAGLGTPVWGTEAQDDALHFTLDTPASDEELLDLMSFHVAREQVQITPLAVPALTAAPTASGPEAGAARASVAAPAPNAHSAEGTSLRVPVAKVDALINLVGELVINQAMLAQNSRGLDAQRHEGLLAGLSSLERNMRDLQASVLSIRMMPVSVVFSRFPRMLRDLAPKLGKQIELVTQGEATELDKGLVEKLIDPLTHLVRNSCDHGIESPEERIAQDKPAHGTITLSAAQQGGAIVIEVSDDGRGLARDRILRKAAERGLTIAPDAPDSELWALVFAPGFSTAEAVTDVSGRGVGMDVVKRNIAELGGSVELQSRPGQGTRVTVRLPLTLAIMDGMSVRSAGEIYILPLASVVESFLPVPGQTQTLAQGAAVVRVREHYLPLLDLAQLFDEPPAEQAKPIIVVVEAEGTRIALRVGEIVGQHQVVVKSLEANYRKVPCLSGATILGDGRVALILEPASLVRRTRH